MTNKNQKERPEPFWGDPEKSLVTYSHRAFANQAEDVVRGAMYDAFTRGIKFGMNFKELYLLCRTVSHCTARLNPRDEDVGSLSKVAESFLKFKNLCEKLEDIPKECSTPQIFDRMKLDFAYWHEQLCYHLASLKPWGERQ